MTLMVSCDICLLMQTVPYEEREVKEANSIGVGCGIMTVAYTSSGCILAGSALGSKGKSSEGPYRMRGSIIDSVS